MALPAICSVDRLGSTEIHAKWQDDFLRPPCVNDLGFFFVAPDPLGIRDLMIPPFAMGGENTALLYINRKHPPSEGATLGYTWFPDRVERRCVLDDLDILSVTRAALRRPAALLSLSVSNPGPRERDVEIAIKVAGRATHTRDGWDKGILRIDHLTGHAESWRFHSGLGAMVFASAPEAFSVQGSRPKPDAVENKSLLYRTHLRPGDTWTLRFVVALGETEDSAATLFRSLIEGFNAACDEIRADWNDKIAAMFTPGNSRFSGHLPRLWTDDPELERLYYMGCVGGALCHRRDHPLSPLGPVYTTLVGDYWPTACFLWDMLISDGCWAMLDPVVLRKMIEAWIEIDLSKYLAVDSITGRGVGNWYAVNDSAIVHMAHTYLRQTGDLAWLDKAVAGKTILDRLEHHALRWRELDTRGHGLADCGNGWNCGDGLATWTHETAGFNAMWVAAQRHVAALRELRGEAVAARSLRQNADALLKALLGLYVDGGGHWVAQQPDGARIPVRALYDFVAVGECIAGDLSDSVRGEMLDFFLAELKTEGWVRGLSAWDDDAVRSFRPDWAWTGSYGAFPAMSVTALRNLGCSEPWILEWLRRVARATWQGPIGQTHVVEAMGQLVKGGVKKSPIGGWSVNATAAFPAMVVEEVFGVRATLRDGLQRRDPLPGLEFTARLDNVPYQGKNYRVTPDSIEKM